MASSERSAIGLAQERRFSANPLHHTTKNDIVCLVKLIAGLALLCGLPLLVAAKRKATGPSLPETTDYISQILNTDGSSSGAVGQVLFLTELSNARGLGCVISYNVEKNYYAGTTRWSESYSVDLDLQSTVAGSLSVGPSAATPGSVSIRLSRPLELKIRKRGDDGIADSTTQVSQLTFTFLSLEVAQRLGNALNHAIEICGGGTKDPFKSR